MASLQYVIKIMDHLEASVLAQIVNPPRLTVDKKLNDFSEATFDLTFASPFANSTVLKQFNRVDIYEQIGHDEYKIFEGVIRGYEADLDQITVSCNDFLFLLSKRVLFSAGYTAVAEAVNTTLASLFSTMNGVDDTGLTVNTTGILTTAVNKEYSRGDDLAKIIKDLAVATEAEFIIRDRQLEFKATIGTDRSIVGSADYRDFRFDINNPNENSIQRASIAQDSKDYANAVLGKADTNYNGQTDSPTITEYGRIETSENFADSGAGGVTEQTTQFLALHKELQRFPKITPRTTDLYFKDIEIGDIIPIYINTGSELFAFDGTYKIVGTKLSRISNAQPVIDLEFSENALSDTTLLDEITKLKSQVKTLILKS